MRAGQIRHVRACDISALTCRLRLSLLSDTTPKWSMVGVRCMTQVSASLSSVWTSSASGAAHRRGRARTRAPAIVLALCSDYGGAVRCAQHTRQLNRRAKCGFELHWRVESVRLGQGRRSLEARMTQLDSQSKGQLEREHSCHRISCWYYTVFYSVHIYCENSSSRTELLV